MLEWTGERFLPWIKESTIAYEHLHRYAYAATLVKDKRVLDLASGEGYGSQILSTAASSVVGIDIDESAIRHAQEKYGSPNIQFMCGSVTAVPDQSDHSFDVVVCFEAIEHIQDQEALISEVKRLLKPDGLFIVSTPNKAVYQEAEHENPFHVRELEFGEFHGLLAAHFRNIRFLGQRIHPCSSIWAVSEKNAGGFQEFVVDRAASGLEFVTDDKRVPLYFIAIASDSNMLWPSASILVDESDSLLKEKAEELQASIKETQWREQQIHEREDTIKSLEQAIKWREGQLHDVSEALEWTRQHADDLEKTISSQEEALTWRAQQVNELGAAKDYWERETASLTTQLQKTHRQLNVASETLSGIYASRGWKLIMKLRNIRDALKGIVRTRS